MKIGYIYIIKNEIRIGGYKIGKSASVEQRLSQLKVGSKASLVGIWSSRQYSKIEREMHTRFAHLRVPQSEWFPLTDDELQQAISILNKRASLEILVPKYVIKEPEPVIAEKPVVVAQPTTFRRSVAIEPRSPYSGPKPVWTDYSGSLPKTSIVPQNPKVKATTTQKSTPTRTHIGLSKTTSSPISDLIGGAFVGWIPLVGWFLTLMTWLQYFTNTSDKQELPMLKYGLAFGTSFSMMMVFSATSEAIEIYEPPAIEQSSTELIK